MSAENIAWLFKEGAVYILTFRGEIKLMKRKAKLNNVG